MSEPHYGLGIDYKLATLPSSVYSENLVNGNSERVVTYDFSYDTLGRLQQKQTTLAARPNHPFVVGYSYDSLGRITDLAYPTQYGLNDGPIVHNDFDSSGKQTALKVDNVNYASDFVYNALGQAESVKIGPTGANQVTETYEYSPYNGLLGNQKVIRGGSTLLDLSYAYQQCSCTTGGPGQVTMIFNNLNSVKNREYNYDQLGRIKRLWGTQYQGLMGWVQTYDYDRYGNRTSSSLGGWVINDLNGAAKGEDKAVDDSLQQKAGGGGGPGGPPPGPVPTVDGHETLTFEATSNRVSSPGFEYDEAGNQTRIVKPDGSALRFQYDAAGRLVKVKNDSQQTINTYIYGVGRERLITQEGNESSANLTFYAWEGGAVIAEYSETASTALAWVKNYIFMGGALLATQEKISGSETVRFHHPDRLGTRLVTDPVAGTHFEQSSLPFGTAFDADSTGSTNPRFTSYDRSGTTGLDYASNRFYDSSQGRFTTVDPIKMSAASILNPQTLNLYSYTANDPVNRTDPSGLDWDIPRIGGTSHVDRSPTFGTQIFGGGSTGMSIPSGLSQFLTGLLGTLFSGGNQWYPGMQVGPTFYTVAPQLDSANMSPSGGSPPLPGAGTIATIDSLAGNFQGPTAAENFNRMWRNHPIRFGNEHPIPDTDANGNYVYTNQCAIRMTIALKSVPTFAHRFEKTFKGLTDRGYALRAKELAEWLPSIFVMGVELTGENKLEQIADKTGILYLEQFRGTTDTDRNFNHIDLWNRGVFARGDIQWIDRAKKVIFFEFMQRTPQ